MQYSTQHCTVHFLLTCIGCILNFTGHCSVLCFVTCGTHCTVLYSINTHFLNLQNVHFVTSSLFQSLLVSIVVLSYFGNEGGRLYFGLQDYLGVGTAGGFSIIIPILLFTYIFDGSIFVLVNLHLMRHFTIFFAIV